MRKIAQFQSTSAYLWALTDDGILWRKTHKGDEWEAVRGPGDGNPFRKPETFDKVAERLKRKMNTPIGPR